jgi:hypothetical protein
LRPAGILEEDDGVVEEGVSAKDLRHPSHAVLKVSLCSSRGKRSTYNLRAAQVRTLEASNERRPRCFCFFEPGGVVDVRHCGIDFLLRSVRCTEPCEVLSSFLISPAADRISRRLGSKVAADKQRHRPDPLKAIGDPPRWHVSAGTRSAYGLDRSLTPLIRQNRAGSDRNGSDHISGTPAHADVGSDVRPKNSRHDLARVRG